MHVSTLSAPRCHQGLLDRLASHRFVNKRRVLSLLATLPSVSIASAAHADTLGGRMQAMANDLGSGFGYALETGGYVLGAIALLAGIYVMWKHQQNPNGPHKMGYGLTSIIAGGAFLSITYIAGYASHTVSDAGPDNTGASQQMRFDN